MGEATRSTKKVKWGNLTFFFITTLFAVGVSPFYFIHAGISASELVLFASCVILTSLSITMGYHRLFAHATYKANSVVRFFVLFFGAAAFQQSALIWASQHRDHHRFVDTDQDPYSIKKGFFYAHMGWMMFWEHPFHLENAKDLQKSWLIQHQHRFYTLWAVTAGILTPVAIGALIGHVIGAFLLAVCVRLTLVYHGTWCINSFCHTFGKATYDIDSSAKDFWLAALITNGEGYHNYHHHFPGDYRNGVCWYQWDPTKWTIALLRVLGLAWDLKKVSEFRIVGARLAAEKQRIEDCFLAKIENPEISRIRNRVLAEYEKLRQVFRDWEQSAREYQAILQRRMARHSEVRRQAALKRIAARRQFQAALAQWRSTIHAQLQAA